MHSGLLFLWPHVFRVVASVEKCGNTHFETHSDMWGFRGEDAFVCKTGNAKATFSSETHTNWPAIQSNASFFLTSRCKIKGRSESLFALEKSEPRVLSLGTRHCNW